MMAKLTKMIKTTVTCPYRLRVRMLSYVGSSVHPWKGCESIVNVFVLIIIIAVKHHMNTSSALIRIAFKAKCDHSLSLLLLAETN